MALAPAIGRGTEGKPPDPLDIPFGGELSISQGARTPREAYFQFLKETGREGGTRSRREFAESKYGIRRPNLEETYLEALEFAVGGGGLATIGRKEALKSLGKGFRGLTEDWRKLMRTWIRNTRTGIVGASPPVVPSKQTIKELIQGIRKAPQKELDFVDELGLTMGEAHFGTFAPRVGKSPVLENLPSKIGLSVSPRLPTGEGINTVLHELGHARMAAGTKRLPQNLEENVARLYGNVVAPFAERAVKEGKKLNPDAVKEMFDASFEFIRIPPTITNRQLRIAEIPWDRIPKERGLKAVGKLTQNIDRLENKLEAARRVLRGQLPGEMRMFLEEAPKLTGESIAKKVGNIRYEGVMEGIPSAGISDIYQFTVLEGPSKGGTFSAGSLDLEDVMKALGKQEDRWRKLVD